MQWGGNQSTTPVRKYNRALPVNWSGTDGTSGQAGDIAEAALFLASPGARYITGQVLVVDGGLAM